MASAASAIDTRPAEPFDGTPGAVVVFSDVACPWATVVVLRLQAAREAAGLVDTLRIIHLAHSLELEHEQPLARRIIDAEIPACAAATPSFGWSLWQGRLDEYPVSSLLPLEAVQAARHQSERAAEELDLALRTALFVASRTISMRHEVITAAAVCPSVDVTRLTEDLDAGLARAAVLRQSHAARTGAATCSGHVVMPDGSGRCNPGVETSWLGPRMPRGAPVVVADDPAAYLEIVTAAAVAAAPSAPSRTPTSSEVRR